MLRELLQLTNSEYGLIGEVWPDEGQPVPRTYAITNIDWNGETHTLLARQAPTLEFRNLKTLFGHVMTSGQPVIANDPAHDPRVGEVPPGHPPIDAFLGLPFFYGGVMTGMVGVANRPGGYDEALVAYLQPFLGTCAQLVEGFRSRCLRSEAEQALRLSEDRFRAAMQGANDGIWDWDLRTNEVYFSERWKHMIGYEDHEISNVFSEWESRLHPEDRPRVLDKLNHYLQSRLGVYDVEFRLRKKDGTYCWIQARGKAMWDAEGHPIRMAGSHAEITERKWEEAVQTVEMQTLQLLAQGQSLNNVLGFLCRAVEAQTAPMLCAVMLVSKEGTHLSSAAAPSLPDAYNQSVHGIPIGPMIGSCGSAAYFMKPVLVGDIATDPRWEDYASLALAHGLKACWSHPIMSANGTLVGTFAAYYRELREPMPHDLKVVERASHIAALAIEHAMVTEALRESEERFRLIFMHEPECVKTVAPDGMLLAMNPTGLRMIEAASLKEVVGRSVMPLIHSDDRSAFWEAHCAAVNGSASALQFRVIGLKGQLRWMDTHSVPLRESGGTITAVLSVTRDITERKKLERASQDQRDRLRLAMDIAGLAIWDWNILTNQVIWSDNCEQVKGLPAGSFEGTFEVYQRLVHPEDLPGLHADIECALRGQKPYHTEHRIVPPTGEVQWIEGNGVVYRDELDRPIRMVGTVRNITDRKRAEQTLRLSEERYARATAVGQVGVWELDVRAGTYYGDRNLKAMFGYQVDELSADPYAWLNLVHPDDQSIAMGHWQRIVSREADGYQYELRMVRKDGTVIWTDVRGHAVRDRDGQVTQLIGATVDITDRKRMEDALRASEEHLRILYDDNPSMYFTVAPDGTILSVNCFGAQQLGYHSDELIGGRVFDIVFEDDKAFVLHELTQAFAGTTGSIKSLEFRKITKEGAIIWVRERLRIVRAEEVGPVALIVCEDISARKKIEEVLAEREEHLRLFIEHSPVALAMLDQDMRYLAISQRWRVDYHLGDQPLIGRSHYEVFPEIPEWWKAIHRRCLAGAVESCAEDPFVRLDGRTEWSRWEIRPWLRSEGTVGGIVIFSEDITARKQAEAAARESEERFALSARATNDGIWDWNILTGAQYWSDRHRELFGLESSDFVTTYTSWMALVHQDDADRVHQTTRRHLDTREPYDVEVRVRMKDGGYRWFRDRGQAVWDAAGRPIRMVGSISDITEQRNAEQALRDAHAELEQRVAERTEQLALMNQSLQEEIVERTKAEEAIRESELRYKLLTEATFDGIAIHDQEVLLEVNPGLERMFGYQPGELIGRSILDLIAEESLGMVAANMRDGVNGPYEAMGRRKDGSIFPGEVVVRPYWYRGKEVRLVAGRDITERKHLEAERSRHTEELERQIVERTAEIATLESQRAQTERLAALGRLAAGVAHEINNPIAGIKNAFELVKQAVDPAHAQYEFVGMVDREIVRVSSIVQNMYQLYRRESGKVETVDLRTMIGDIEALFAKQLQQRQLRLVVEAEFGFDKLDVPRSDLLQVLLNLLNNAMDCSSEGAAITMTIREEAEAIRIALADQGSGISPEILPHIFDPFFTTKTEGEQKGMGLGLSISQSLVNAMGGRIDVRTQLGHGSTFSVLLPRHRVVACLPDQTQTSKEVITHGC
jgi:PAS domain S-box-containing protein